MHPAEIMFEVSRHNTAEKHFCISKLTASSASESLRTNRASQQLEGACSTLTVGMLAERI
eukprot:5286841-Pyramimonas_sp.AAC.1